VNTPATPERTVQVPVSLIERAIQALGVIYDDSIYPDVVTELTALLSQPNPTVDLDRTPCSAETYSWDHFRPEQVDSYWITCDVLGPHDEHQDEHTGLTWRDPSTIRDVTSPKEKP